MNKEYLFKISLVAALALSAVVMILTGYQRYTGSSTFGFDVSVADCPGTNVCSMGESNKCQSGNTGWDCRCVAAGNVPGCGAWRCDIYDAGKCGGGNTGGGGGGGGGNPPAGGSTCTVGRTRTSVSCGGICPDGQRAVEKCTISSNVKSWKFSHCSTDTAGCPVATPTAPTTPATGSNACDTSSASACIGLNSGDEVGDICRCQKVSGNSCACVGLGNRGAGEACTAQSNCASGLFCNNKVCAKISDHDTPPAPTGFVPECGEGDKVCSAGKVCNTSTKRCMTASEIVQGILDRLTPTGPSCGKAGKFCPDATYKCVNNSHCVPKDTADSEEVASQDNIKTSDRARIRGRFAVPRRGRNGDVSTPPTPPRQTPPPPTSAPVPPVGNVPPSSLLASECNPADYPSIKMNGCGVNVGCPTGQQKADRCVLHDSGTHFIIKYDQCVTTVECAPAINLNDDNYYLFSVAEYGQSCSVATPDKPIATTICNPTADGGVRGICQYGPTPFNSTSQGRFCRIPKGSTCLVNESNTCETGTSCQRAGEEFKCL